MQDKLKHSQRLLEGLAMADFQKITDNAEELMQPRDPDLSLALGQ